MRRPVLILLATFMSLAAGLMTAIFISRHPTPVEFQQATIRRSVQCPCDEAA